MEAKEPREPPITFELTEATDGVIGSRSNVLEGLALHRDVIDPEHERELVAWAEEKARLGRAGRLPGDTFMQSTFTDPVTNRRRPGRLVLQFGSYYDYGAHNIRPLLHVEPMDATLERLVDKLVSVGALPTAVRPDTAIINVYRIGDSIPPHVDHPAYPRPFSTLSLLCDAPMLFGTTITPLRNGAFRGAVAHTLPRRSLLVFGPGSGADVAKHCVPSVAHRRISITLRRQPDWARRANERARAAPPLLRRMALPLPLPPQQHDEPIAAAAAAAATDAAAGSAQIAPSRSPDPASRAREAGGGVAFSQVLSQIIAVGVCDASASRACKGVSRAACAGYALGLLESANRGGDGGWVVLLLHTNPGLEAVCAAELAFICRTAVGIRLRALGSHFNRGSGCVVAVVAADFGESHLREHARLCARAQEAVLSRVRSARNSRRVCMCATLRPAVPATPAAACGEAQQLRRAVERGPPVPELLQLLAVPGAGFRATGVRVREQSQAQPRRQPSPASRVDATGGVSAANNTADTPSASRPVKKARESKKRGSNDPMAQQTSLSSVNVASAVGGALAQRHSVPVRLRGFLLDVSVHIVGRTVLTLVGRREPKCAAEAAPAAGTDVAACDAQAPPTKKQKRLAQRQRKQQQQQSMEPSVAYGMLHLCLGSTLLEALRRHAVAQNDAPRGSGDSSVVLLDPAIDCSNSAIVEVADHLAAASPEHLIVRRCATAERWADMWQDDRSAVTVEDSGVAPNAAALRFIVTGARPMKGSGGDPPRLLDVFYEELLLDAYNAFAGGGEGCVANDGAARLAILVNKTNVLSRIVSKLYLMWRFVTVRPISTKGTWSRICVLEAIRTASIPTQIETSVVPLTRKSPHDEMPAIGLLRLNLLRSRIVRRLARLRGGKRDDAYLGTSNAEEIFSKWVFCVGSTSNRSQLQQMDAVVPYAVDRDAATEEVAMLTRQIEAHIVGDEGSADTDAKRNADGIAARLAAVMVDECAAVARLCARAVAWNGLRRDWMDVDTGSSVTFGTWGDADGDGRDGEAAQSPALVESFASIGHEQLEIGRICRTRFDALCAAYARSGDAACDSNASVLCCLSAGKGRFATRLATMLLRYQAVSLGSSCLGMQAALPPAVFEQLQRHFDVECECFASPLNATLPKFCSFFDDTDRYFGSEGSFFNFQPREGSFECNPVFVTVIAERMGAHILELLASSQRPLSFVVVLPASLADAFVKDTIEATPFGTECLRHTLSVARGEHCYVRGDQHQCGRGQQTLQSARVGTKCLFLQNAAGCAKWPPSEAACSDIATAFNSGGL